MTHPTHKTRGSDSSLYDAVCTLCGTTDASNAINLPCPKVASAEDIIKMLIEAWEKLDGGRNFCVSEIQSWLRNSLQIGEEK